MNYIMRFPLVSKLFCVKGEPSIVPIDYIEIDLTKLIDDWQYFKNLLFNFEQKERLDYYVLITISEWLFECYKKINHYIMSNRIMNALTLTLGMANNVRDFNV